MGLQDFADYGECKNARTDDLKQAGGTTSVTSGVEDSLGSIASLSYPIIGATYAFAAAVQPGPLQAFLISQTLSRGWRRTVPAVLAPVLSDMPVICLVLFVLTHIPPLLVHVLRFAGGLFLLYLALGAFRTYRNYRHTMETIQAPVGQTLMKATLVNLMNPNPYLGWSLVLGPLLIRAWDQSPAEGVAFLAAFYGILLLTTALILALFAGARSLGSGVARTPVGVSAAALFLFGLY